MEIPTDYLKRFTFVGSPEQIQEYSDTINRMAKMVGQPYIVMHKRIERMFSPSMDSDNVLAYLRRWLHEASKNHYPGIVINSRMKQYRETFPIKKEKTL